MVVFIKVTGHSYVTIALVVDNSLFENEGPSCELVAVNCISSDSFIRYARMFALGGHNFRSCALPQVFRLRFDFSYLRKRYFVKKPGVKSLEVFESKTKNSFGVLGKQAPFRGVLLL